jgi:phosphinothricin acetyltransferase
MTGYGPVRPSLARAGNFPLMTVREAAEGDLPGILEITNREILEGYAHFGEETLSLRELHETWMAGRERFPWFVAAEDSLVLGFARGNEWKSRGAYKRTAEVGVYVRPDRQGQGIGRALYDALLPEMERRGFHTLLAGIALPNDASIRLHESFGFRHVGTLPEVGFKLGDWRDVGFWVYVARSDPR